MTAEKVLDTARKELGSKESPAGSNRTKYGKWFGLDGCAWCMMFVMWVFAMAGLPLPHKSASCSALLSWYQKNRPQSVVKTPAPGDVVIYAFGHTGIVEAVGSGSVTAIEGNTSPDSSGSQSDGGMVCRKTRKTSAVKACIRPDYEEEENLNIDKLTGAELIRLAGRMQAALSKRAVSAKLAPELAEAKALGITDGSSPCAFAARAQAAVMDLRALKG